VYTHACFDVQFDSHVCLHLFIAWLLASSQQLDKARKELHAKDTENDTLSRQIQHLLQQTTRRAQGGALVSRDCKIFVCVLFRLLHFG
jgi:hypothetical protein